VAGWPLMPGPVVREIQSHMSTTRLPIRTPSRQGERCRSRHVPLQQTKKDQRVGNWATENNVELAYVPTNASWLNRIEYQFTALRYFTLDGTDHRSHEEQNRLAQPHKDNEARRDISMRAKVA
jgi:hypothetical protein